MRALSESDLVEGLRLALRNATLRYRVDRSTSTSITQLMEKVVQQLGAESRTSERRRWQAYAVEDREVREYAAGLLKALRERDSSSCARKCILIGSWAEKHALPTALWFTQAAVLFDPADAGFANKLGKLALRRADHAAAQRWYRQGIEAGEAAGRWDAVAVGLSGLALIDRKQGRHAEAAESLRRSLAVAREHGLTAREGEAFHALAVLAFEQQKYHEAISFARRALDAYGTDRPRIMVLANDLAWVWMDRDKAYSRALPVFDECLRSERHPAYRVIMLGNLGRAAAGMGDALRFRQAAEELYATLPLDHHEEGHAAGLLELAKGAASLGLQEQARRDARQALEVAAARRETALIQEIKEFQRETEVGGSSHYSTHHVVIKRSVPVEQRMDDLVMELILALR